MPPSDVFRFSIDRGGTFTDIYAEVPGLPGFRVLKLLSEDPSNYPDAPREGVRRILQDVSGVPLSKANFDSSVIEWIRMGTTLATNALLERKGRPCALLITKGFGDLLTIGKQDRPKIFDLEISRPPPLYQTVVEVDERVRLVGKELSEGREDFERGVGGQWIEVIEELDFRLIQTDLEALRLKGVDSLAVVLMHASVFPRHEKEIRDLAKKLGFGHVSLSSEVMPRIKIVDRGQTCCLDAYLTPVIQKYVDRFRAGFMRETTQLHFMQSDGALASADDFMGSRAVLSGPAGGVVGYAKTTFDSENPRPVIGFDMGGTSTDVSRFDGDFDWVQETETAGVHLLAPQLNINTVAAGGGSRLFFKNGMFVVGPESAGAHPGPVCYRKKGFLTVTDANLVLGRLLPERFPKIFGPAGNLALDRYASQEALQKLVDQINGETGDTAMSQEEAAHGFIQVANETMARSIREITLARGHDAREHILACFGGAGGQHACSIARLLGIKKIFVHRFAGVLSAYGLGLADRMESAQEPSSRVLDATTLPEILERLDVLLQTPVEKLKIQGFSDEQQEVRYYLNLRFKGTDTSLMVLRPSDDDFNNSFRRRYRREFGFEMPDRDIWVDDLKVQVVGKTPGIKKIPIAVKEGLPEPETNTSCYFGGGWLKTPVFLLDALGAGQVVPGPAIIIHQTTTILVEPECRATITEYGDVEIEMGRDAPKKIGVEKDPVQLAVFGARFMSIAEQMGRILERTAISTNIKERRDFSCALFGPEGDLVANAPHQPVHLGSMGEAVKEQIRLTGGAFREGDVLMTNHPAVGGSHLPDITVITPVLNENRPIFFVASRGHHADVGGISPGSMPPFSKNLEEEGVSFKSFKLVEGGIFNEEGVARLLLKKEMETASQPGDPIPGTRALADNISDLKAQVAANQKGVALLEEIIGLHSLQTVQAYMRHIQSAAEATVRAMIKKVSLEKGLDEVGVLEAEDFMDDGTPLRLKLTLDRRDGSAVFDFAGTGPQVAGNCNTPKTVTHSAVLYCLRCLAPGDMPLNQGCLNPVRIEIPEGSILSPSEGAAVAAGNVLTSQRIVDVVLKAFGAAAASQGCMNNFTFGNERFGYYETIGGGSGAGPNWRGQSGVHTHMTNTRITDPEILETRYPVLLREFSIRKGSGGAGKNPGGDGLIREVEFLEPLNVAILSDRRVYAPYGLEGGEPGQKGKNVFIRKDGEEIDLGGKNEIRAEPGDRIRIHTPGAGGFGKAI